MSDISLGARQLARHSCQGFSWWFLRRLYVLSRQHCMGYFEGILYCDLCVLQAVPEEAIPDGGGELGFMWAMKVKQGFKCRAYKTPECRADEVCTRSLRTYLRH